MPLDLLCLLRGCRTVLLAAEFPACLALPLATDFSLGTALAAPAGQQQSGHLLATADGSWVLFGSVENTLLSVRVSVRMDKFSWEDGLVEIYEDALS